MENDMKWIRMEKASESKLDSTHIMNLLNGCIVKCCKAVWDGDIDKNLLNVAISTVFVPRLNYDKDADQMHYVGGD